MKIPIDDVIAKINEALTESDEPLIEADPNEIRGVLTDQLPPYVTEIEEQLFEDMLQGFIKLHGSDPAPDTLESIRFIARAEAVRRHTYRKLAMNRMNEFIDSPSDVATQATRNS